MLASTLQAAWGVAPRFHLLPSSLFDRWFMLIIFSCIPPFLIQSYQTWNSAKQSISDDYTFATGHTPFGFFSTSIKLSSFLKDSISRSLLLKMVNETSSELRDYLKQIQVFFFLFLFLFFFFKKKKE